MPDEKREWLEREFFSSWVDDRAATSMRVIIEKGVQALTSRQRSDWTRFLIAQRLRTPEMIEYLRTEASDDFRANLNLDTEEYERERDVGDPQTLEEWTEENRPGLIENFGLFMLPEMIDNPKFHNEIRTMGWWTEDFSGASVDLLTSDRPCLFVSSPNGKIRVFAIPLTPQLAFFACNEAWMRRELLSRGISKLAKYLNESIVRAAVESVYGTGRQHFRFVERRLR